MNIMDKRQRVAFVTENMDLVAQFKQEIEYFEENRVYSRDSILQSTLGIVMDIDILIVSSDIMNETDLINVRNNYFKSVSKVFYIAEELNIKSLKTDLLSMNGIDILPAFLTDIQIVQKVKKVIGAGVKNNIICFFGCAPQVGTTMVCQSIATMFARSTGKSIVIVDMSGNGGGLFSKKTPVNYLDSVRGNLEKGNISKEILEKQCIKLENNLDYYVGVKGLLDARYYSVKDIEILINGLYKMYDYVFIDSGSPNDFEMGIGALNNAYSKVLIVKPRPRLIDRFIQYRQEVLDVLQLNDFSVIYNFATSLDSKEMEYSAEKLQQYKALGSLEDSEMGLRCELEGIILYDIDKRRQKQWELIETGILSLFNEQKSVKKTSFFGR